MSAKDKKHSAKHQHSIKKPKFHFVISMKRLRDLPLHYVLRFIEISEPSKAACIKGASFIWVQRFQHKRQAYIHSRPLLRLAEMTKDKGGCLFAAKDSHEFRIAIVENNRP